MEPQYPLPEHYHELANELEPLIAMLREVLMYYPSPEGQPLEDISGLIEENNSLMKQNVEDLMKATMDISREVLINEYVPRETIQRAVARIEEPLLSMITCYHNFWERPFPAGLEEGQTLFTAVLRKPVEDYLKELERVVFLINNPDVASEEGAQGLTLKAVFDIEDEKKQFFKWLKKRYGATKNFKKKSILALLAALSAGFIMAFYSIKKAEKTNA